jgi:hypothetical protein
MPKAKKWLADTFEAVGVYFFTFLGIVLSQYAPLLLKQGKIDTPFEWIRLAISAAIAFYIVATNEATGDPDGKRNNLKHRLAHSFAQGYAWNGMIGIAGQAAGAP